MARRHLDHAIALSALALVAWGCSPASDDDARAAFEQAQARPKTVLDDEAQRAAQTAQAPGALAGPARLLGDAAPGRQLPADVGEALRGSVEPWMFTWRAGLGTFRLEELARTDTQPLDPDDADAFDGNAEGVDLRLLYLAMPSPDGQLLLDPYLGWTLEGSGRHVKATREDFAGVALIDLHAHVTRPVLDGRGPGARIDAAMWLDEHRFIVFAAEQIGAKPWRGGPVIYVVDLAAKSITRYAGPSGDQGVYASVEADFERVFRKRFPATEFAATP